jgi:hypothetical protein
MEIHRLRGKYRDGQKDIDRSKVRGWLPLALPTWVIVLTSILTVPIQEADDQYDQTRLSLTLGELASCV